MQTTRTVKAMS